MHCRICDREREELTDDGVCEVCDEASQHVFEEDEDELLIEDMVILGIDVIPNVEDDGDGLRE